MRRRALSIVDRGAFGCEVRAGRQGGRNCLRFRRELVGGLARGW